MIANWHVECVQRIICYCFGKNRQVEDGHKNFDIAVDANVDS